MKLFSRAGLVEGSKFIFRPGVVSDYCPEEENGPGRCQSGGDDQSSCALIVVVKNTGRVGLQATGFGDVYTGQTLAKRRNTSRGNDHANKPLLTQPDRTYKQMEDKNHRPGDIIDQDQRILFW
jgi:hypothetical protein